MITQKKKVLLSSFISFFLTLSLFLLADYWLTRRFKPTPAKESPARTASTLYHHDLVPMGSSPSETYGPYTYPLYVNSLGFRDFNSRKVPLYPKHKTTLLIGDSFTEGVGLPYENTFAGRLTKKFAKKGHYILNAGTASYAPAIYHRKVKHLIEDKGIRFSNLWVFLDISDIQDSVFYTVNKNGEVGTKDNLSLADLTRNIRLGDFGYMLSEHFSQTFKLYSRLRCRVLPDRCKGNARSQWTTNPYFFEVYGKEGLEQAQFHLTRLRDYLKKQNIPMHLVVYPWPDQIKERDFNSTQVTFWQKWASENAVTFHNLFPLFVKDPPEKTITAYYLKDDCHWNAKGHELVAKYLYRQMLPTDDSLKRTNPQSE